MESLLRRSCADQLRRAHSARRVRALILRVASLGRDAQNERDGAGDATRRMSATELVCAAVSQQRCARTMSGRRGRAGKAIAWKMCQKQGDTTTVKPCVFRIKLPKELRSLP